MYHYAEETDTYTGLENWYRNQLPSIMVDSPLHIPVWVNMIDVYVPI